MNPSDPFGPFDDLMDSTEVARFTRAFIAGVVLALVLLLLILGGVMCAPRTVGAWPLSFTLPTRDASSAASCPLGCRDTATSLAPCTDAAAYELWCHWQSPTWIARHAEMQADRRPGGLWDQLWPTCAGEADYHLLTRYPGPLLAGAHVTITLADTIPTGRWYFVRVLDAAGNASCMSGEVYR